MPMSPRLLRPRAVGGDSDVLRYIAAVEAADGQALEQSVKDAIRDFILGCKTDNIWTAIRASCILMGARTLSGALTPLVGAAPTNNGPFVSGDYNRKTGLIGNGTTKFLNTNRANNADGQDDRHLAVYSSAVGTQEPGAYAGAGGNSTGCMNLLQNGGGIFVRCVPQDANTATNGFSQVSTMVAGFFGTARSGASVYVTRYNTAGGASQTTFSEPNLYGNPSGTPTSDNVFVFARNSGSGTAQVLTGARLTYYSIGANISLALLDSRVTTLYNAIGAAIP